MGNTAGPRNVDERELEVELMKKNVSAPLGDEANGVRSAARYYGLSPRNVLVRVYDLPESRETLDETPGGLEPYTRTFFI
jgi:hypothetical protein